MKPLASLLLLGAALGLASAACRKSNDGAADSAPEAAPAPSATVVVVDAGPPPPAPSASAAVHAKPREPLEMECKATNADGPIELELAWDRDMAHGVLKLTKAGKPVTEQVIAQLYKGLVLVDPPGTKNLVGGIATVDNNSAERNIRIGDYKQPTFPCQ